MNELSISELQTLMTSGEATAYSLVEHYLNRTEQYDRNGPALNAVIEINPDALETAAALDEERRKNGPRGPLHGVPIMLKDNIGTADKLMTTAGSLALVGSKPEQDAPLVAKLRNAGAVILGKTNLSEWANFRSPRSSSGWSSRGGQTKNPYALPRNPCGSSSGSGVAVSANLCVAAIGTETDGSIVCPAGVNGVVGLKPTVGLINSGGVIPISHSQDTAGPMTRSVTDAAILLGVLVDTDLHRDADYTRFLLADGLKGARVGVARSFFGFHDRVDAVVEDALAALCSEGAELIDVELESGAAYSDSEFEVLLYEFKHGLNAYLQSLGPDAPVRSLEDVIAFNERHAERVMPYFGQEHLLKAQLKGPLSEPAYLTALARSKRLARESVDAALEEHRLEALVAPTNGPAWTTDLINGDHVSGGSSTPAAVAGYPNLTVPAGFVGGLPIGLSFFSTAYREPTLLKLAFAFEQVTKARRVPGLTSDSV